MTLDHSLVNPNDSIERQNEKLLTIVQSLMRRVEQKSEQTGLAYQQFERAALLESEVRERTRDLERALDLLQETNARLAIANDETEKARSNLTEAIETVNEGFALFEEDDGLVLSNSRFCRDFLDIESGLVSGLPFEEYVTLISESAFIALPDYQKAQDWAVRRLRTHKDDHAVFNVRLKGDRWLQVSEHRTSRGGTVILQTDVTSIIRNERQERDRMRDRQAEMLQATLDHLNQGVCIFDKTQTLVGWNSHMDGFLTGSPSPNVLGTSFDVLLSRLEGELIFDGTMSADDLRLWGKAEKIRPPIAFEVNRTGSQVLSVFGQEMPDRGFVISFTDVTPERNAAKALSDMNELLEQRVEDRTQELGVALLEAERANASKSRFVAAASHDLLQPLSAAKLFVSSLSEAIATPEAQHVIDKTEMALNSVEQFISALLDISKLDADKAVFEVQPIKLSQIFDPLRNEMTPLAQAKGIDLRVVDSSAVVLSDPGYLRRIVQNLLSNAIRYSDKGKVLLGVRRHAGFVRIEVCDTGIGIAPEDQATIFKEFERLSPTNSDVSLGLGLAIVERACKGLGHKIHLRSERGVGSCFAVDVPCSDAALKPPSARHSAEALLLLVEPNVKEAQAMSDAIEHLGAKVLHVQTAQEALSLLEEVQLVPDLMLITLLEDQSDAAQDAMAPFWDGLRAVFCAILIGDQVEARHLKGIPLGVPMMKKPLNLSQIRAFLDQRP